MKESESNFINNLFGTLISGFLLESLSHMLPWLVVSFTVIICDLCFGVRKAMLMNEEVRISRAVRRTMGKMLTYFWFVCMSCTIEVAAGSTLGIDKWACLLICLFEFCSIVSNILKPKGYKLNVRKLFALVAGKVAGVEKENLQELIEENKNEKR